MFSSPPPSINNEAALAFIGPVEVILKGKGVKECCIFRRRLQSPSQCFGCDGVNDPSLHDHSLSPFDPIITTRTTPSATGGCITI